jgi:hypothetical protein
MDGDKDADQILATFRKFPRKFLKGENVNILANRS